MVDVLNLLDPRIHVLADLVEGARVVRRVHHAHLGERRVERRQALHRRAGPWVFVVVQRQRPVVVVDRDDAPVEVARIDRRRRARLALHAEPVAIFAREPFDGGDKVCRDALRHERILRVEMCVVRRKAVHVERRRARHRLDATRDNERLLAGHHAHGGHVHGLLGGAAEAVERDAGHRHRPARVERGHPGDVHRVVTDA